MSVRDLPTLNAALNGLATLLLVAGWIFIRRRDIARHRLCMLAAFGVSVAFLVSYLVYHYHAGSVRFPDLGWLRTLYLGILLTHTVLAATVPFLAGVTLVHALRSRFDRHRRIARWTLPIWIYVSVTGVVIYWMLYHLAGASAG
jgi:uncharacterized membrane protein YozB (DUF420 family)